MKRWISLQAIAKEHADLSERTLRKYLNDPIHPLPARRVRGKWIVAIEDFDLWFRGFPRAGEDVERIVNELMSDLQEGKKK